MKIEIGQVVSQIISFLIMYWILSKFAWKPILKLLHDRRDKIKAEFDLIDQEKQANERLQKEYQKQIEEIDDAAHKKIHEAIEKGRQISFEIEHKAHEQAKKIVDKAEEEAKQEIKKAKVQLKEEIVGLTLQVTKQVLGKELDEAKQKALVMDFVNQAVTK